ncbi:MAG: hypothetical protein RI953_2595 [Pseudomonadota bacterium]
MHAEIEFKSIASRLDEIVCAYSNDAAARAANSEPDTTYLFWQLTWALSVCGVATSARTISNLRARIFSAEPDDNLSVIQYAWMRQCDLPGYVSTHNLKSFFESLCKIFARDSQDFQDDDFVYQFLRRATGLPAEMQAEISALIAAARTLPKPKHLSLIPKHPTIPWLTIQEVASRSEFFIGSSAAAKNNRVVFVALPPPLSAPMTWSLPALENAKMPTVFLGWPVGAGTQLTREEQLALVAHECCHVNQLLSEANEDSLKGQAVMRGTFARELQALRAEWEELLHQCEKLSSPECERLKSRWRMANETEQIRLLQKDLLAFEKATSNSGAPAEQLGHLFQESLRMPFTTLVYALCARMVQPQGLEPRTPAV